MSELAPVRCVPTFRACWGSLLGVAPPSFFVSSPPAHLILKIVVGVKQIWAKFEKEKTGVCLWVSSG